MTFKDLLDELLETYEKKNADYGDSFKKTHLQFGEIAGLVRISDKVNRLISLSKKTTDSQNYESKRDTYMDLANYCLMQVLVMGETESTELTGQAWAKKVQELIVAREANDIVEEMDAIGDILVVLCGYCVQRDYDLVTCLEVAYEEIKDRKGYVNDQGVFVKEM